MISDRIFLLSSGDSRLSANQTCWPAQQELESKLTSLIAAHGIQVVRGNPVHTDEGHGFIRSQREGLDAFSKLDPEAPIIIATAAWQYSHHVLPGLFSHRGPILTVANWSGTWPGLVGLLNLNGSLTKAGVPYSTLWSEAFEDEWALAKLSEWLETGRIRHQTDHVSAFVPAAVDDEVEGVVRTIRNDLMGAKSIIGVFDEGCMGMYNAIVPDDLLMEIGIFKERLSQSALYFETTRVSDEEAARCLLWLEGRGMTFHFGSDDATELTREQVLTQCKTYIALVRLAEEYGCEAVGVQYQQGLRDLLPASDLAEGLLNNDDRPPVAGSAGSVIRDGHAIVHFNEVDECAAVDGILTNRIHRAFGAPVENTLHDLRWGEVDPASGEFVWVFEISGAAPPAHHTDGYRGTSSMRQPAMFFRKGGGTVRGIAKEGEIVWSRVFVENGMLKLDIGRGKAVALSDAEQERRWQATNYEWPMMNAVLYGTSRDQMMARHKANHIQVAYGDDAAQADKLALGKAALAHELGIDVSWCGWRPVSR